MQIGQRSIAVANSTLRTLIAEFDTECRNVTTLISQLQLLHLTSQQRAEILADLLASTIHLNAHCGEEFQALIAEEMETLPDEDETD